MTQTVDFRFELLFLFCVLSSLIGLLAALMLTIRARRSAAKRLLTVLGTGWTVYLAIVFLVAATTPQRAIPMHQDLCSDELCFAVVQVQTASQLGPVAQPVRANGVFYIITVRASSHARGRSQSERGLHALLWSPRGRHTISPVGQSAWDAAHPENVVLSTRLNPGQMVLSNQVFDLPAGAGDLGLVLTSGFTPGYLVIGESPLFHKPTVLRVSP